MNPTRFDACAGGSGSCASRTGMPANSALSTCARQTGLCLAWAALLAAGAVDGSEVKSPTTLPTSHQFGESSQKAAAAPWRFIVTGDSRGTWYGEPFNPVILPELAEEIVRVNPAFVVLTGDLVYQGALAAFQSWRDAFGEVYDAGIGVFPVLGNHDASDVPGFKSVFGSDLPDNGPAGAADRTFFIAHENVLVLALDQYVGPAAIDQTWINSVLATNTRPHIFAMGHMPAFKVAHYDCLDADTTQRDAFWNSLKAAGGRGYFAGHDHFYDHLRVDDGDGNAANDLHQWIVGTGGAPLYGNGEYDGDNSVWTPVRVHHENNYGYVLVEIDGPRATLTWYQRTAPGVYEATEDAWSYVATRPPRLGLGRDFPSEGLRLSVEGVEGESCVIESSPDLETWTPVSTNAVVAGAVQLAVDPSLDGRRFFRVRP